MDTGNMGANRARAGELMEAVGGAAGGLVEAVGEAAATVAKAIGETAAPLAGMIETGAETLAAKMESAVDPVAKSAGGKVDAFSEDLEVKLKKARKDLAANAKGFRFGQREGLILGIALGVFATVWLIRKIDRQAAASRLQAAGSRVGEATQGLTSKAGTLAGQAGDRVGQVVQGIGTRTGDVVQQIRDQASQTVEGAKQRFSDSSGPMQEVTISQALEPESTASGLDSETRAAIAEVADEVEQVQEEAEEQARELGLSEGMKVVAFDGTDIGRVQEVREDVFVLNRPKGSDLLVPLTEVARIEGTVAYLRIEAGRVVKMGWENA